MAKKHAPKRSEIQKAIDRDLITKLSLMRWSMVKMSRHPDLQHISYDQIRYDVKVIEKKWQESTIMQLDTHKKKQLNTLDAIIAESLQAFENSKRDRIKKHMKKKTDVIDGIDTVTGKEDEVHTETRSGDANFLKRILESIAEQNKLLGHYSLPKGDKDSTDSLDSLVEALDRSFEQIKNTNTENAND